MKKLSSAAAIAAVLCASYAPLAWSAHNNQIFINNKSAFAVWVTTYRASDHRDGIIKAECFLPSQSRPMNSTSHGGWVLFEYKSSASSCANHANMRVVERNVNEFADIGSGSIAAN